MSDFVYYGKAKSNCKAAFLLFCICEKEQTGPGVPVYKIYLKEISEK